MQFNICINRINYITSNTQYEIIISLCLHTAEMLLQIILTHRTFPILHQPTAYALPVKIMKTHQKSLLLIFLYITLTYDAISWFACMLGPGQYVELLMCESFLLLFRVLTIRLCLVEVEDSSPRTLDHGARVLEHHFEIGTHLLEEMLRVEAVGTVPVAKSTKSAKGVRILTVVHPDASVIVVSSLHGLVLVLRVRVTLTICVGLLRALGLLWLLRPIKHLLRRPVIVSTILHLISVILSTRRVRAINSVVAAIVEPHLHSRALIASERIIIAIDSKIEAALFCRNFVVVAVDGESDAGPVHLESIVIAVDVDDEFAVFDQKSVAVAMDVEVALFVIEVYRVIAAGIVHFFLLFIL